MHMVIGVIVGAEDGEEALDKAKETLNSLVERGDFDYYTTFDVDGHGMSGKDRWGELPVVANIESREGKKLVEDGLKQTQNDFERAITKVRKLLQRYNNDELFEEFCTHEEVAAKLSEEIGEELRDLHMAHYWLASAGMRYSWDTYLWDDEGERIENKRTLEYIVVAYKKEKKKIFVVPSDVHH